MKRRMFLRGLGGAALATPLLGSLEPPTARAQTSSPRRWLTFYTGNGVQMDNWFPSQTSGALDATHFAGTSLEVLASHAPKMLFPRGLSMTPRGFDIQDHFDPHDQGMGSKLTADLLATADPWYPVAHSVDFEAGWRVNPGGANPLVLGVGLTGFGGVKAYTSYEAPETPYTPETSVLNVYRSLTGLFTEAGAEGEALAQNYLATQKQSVIDLVAEDLQSFKKLPMSSADQHKVDDWLALLRETEVRMISASCNSGLPALLGFTEADVNAADAGSGFRGTDEDRFVTGGDIMLRLAVMAMVCDANRVITLQWQGLGGPTFTWDGMTHMYTHHQLSHRTGTDTFIEGDPVPGVEEFIMEIDRWYAGRFKTLLDLADSFVESDGTVLDNSAIMWLNELADGESHSNNNLPTIIAGGLGGTLKRGEAVDLGIDAGGPFAGFDNSSGTPLTQLYTTLLNGLGATADDGGPIQSFGNMEYGQPGEIDEIKA